MCDVVAEDVFFNLFEQQVLHEKSDFADALPVKDLSISYVQTEVFAQFVTDILHNTAPPSLQRSGGTDVEHLFLFLEFSQRQRQHAVIQAHVQSLSRQVLLATHYWDQWLANRRASTKMNRL